MSFLKRQNVSRSLSLRSAILENMEHEKYDICMENVKQIPDESSVDVQGCDSSGTIRLSTKKVVHETQTGFV